MDRVRAHALGILRGEVIAGVPLSADSLESEIVIVLNTSVSLLQHRDTCSEETCTATMHAVVLAIQRTREELDADSELMCILMNLLSLLQFRLRSIDGFLSTNEKAMVIACAANLGGTQVMLLENRCKILLGAGRVEPAVKAAENAIAVAMGYGETYAAARCQYLMMECFAMVRDGRRVKETALRVDSSYLTKASTPLNRHGTPRAISALTVYGRFRVTAELLLIGNGSGSAAMEHVVREAKNCESSEDTVDVVLQHRRRNGGISCAVVVHCLVPHETPTRSILLPKEPLYESL